jgi:hypothetical protein
LVVVVDCTRTQSYYRRDFAAADHLARDPTVAIAKRATALPAVAPVINTNFG